MFEVSLAAELKDYDPTTTYFKKRDLKKLSPFIIYGMEAAYQAHADANLKDEDYPDLFRKGVFVGSGIGGLDIISERKEQMMAKGGSPAGISPYSIPSIIGNLASGNISIVLNCKGPSLDIVTACASGTHSIGEAFKAIRNNELDMAYAGGTEAAITDVAIAGFQNMTALSKASDKDYASIPFDTNRNGFVMGEGAGVLVLEELESAKARGANILAELVGYGSTTDAFHITQPNPNGDAILRAIDDAHQMAGLGKDEMSAINAHGTSTPTNDKTETSLFEQYYGEHSSKIACTSSKCMTGHLLGAAGAIESVLAVKYILNNIVTPTIGTKAVDEACGNLDYVLDTAKEMEVNTVLKTSLGFGGHNAALIFKKFND